MTAAETVFKVGFAPGVPADALADLRDALDRDDPSVGQGFTTSPPPLSANQDLPVECACPVSWTAWLAGANPACLTVGEVETAFARLCFEADARLGEPAACRWFLNWVDDAPREEVRRHLSRWIADVLAARAREETGAREAVAF